MTTPRLKTSLRGSTWPPAICSGLMYGPDPITLPTAVRGSTLQSSFRDSSSSRVIFAMPKSSTFRCPRCVQYQVGCFDVTVGYALCMGNIQRVGNLHGDVDDLRRREWPLTDSCGDGLPFDVFHGD